MNDEKVSQRENGLGTLMEDAHSLDFVVWGMKKWTQLKSQTLLRNELRSFIASSKIYNIFLSV